jgi:hypothetical protein
MSRVPRDGNKYGEYRYPGDLKMAVCHDLLGAIIYFLLFIAFLVIMIVGCVNGRAWIYILPDDSIGNFCGRNNQDLRSEIGNDSFPLYDYGDYPYLLFAADTVTLEKQICVKECPSSGDLNEVLAPHPFQHLDDWCPQDLIICPPWTNYKDHEELCTCAYKTESLLHRCVPTGDGANVTSLIDKIEKFLGDIPLLGRGIASVSANWDVIVVMSIVSIVFAIIWIILLRCLTKPLVYLMIFLVPAVFVALGVFLFVDGAKIVGRIDQMKFRIAAIVCWVIAGVLVVILIFTCSSLKRGIAIMEISSRALGSNLNILVLPLFALLIGIFFFILFVISSVMNYSSGTFTVIGGHLSITINKTLQNLLIYNLIYFIFICVHCYFVNYYAISAVLTPWYFCQDDDDLPPCRCVTSIWYAFTRGLGPITVVSLIMTPLYIFIAFMEWLQYKAERESDSCIVKCLLKCCTCCLKCFAKIAGYVNKALLTVHQIYNIGFCESAGKVFDVLNNDLGLTLILNGICRFILWLSKLIVAGLCALFAFLRVRSRDEKVDWVLPVVVVFLASFVLGGMVLAMFDMVVEVTFVCFICDKKMMSDGASAMYCDGETQQMFDDLKDSRFQGVEGN